MTFVARTTYISGHYIYFLHKRTYYWGKKYKFLSTISGVTKFVCKLNVTSHLWWYSKPLNIYQFHLFNFMVLYQLLHFIDYFWRDNIFWENCMLSAISDGSIEAVSSKTHNIYQAYYFYRHKVYLILLSNQFLFLRWGTRYLTLNLKIYSLTITYLLFFLLH